MINRKEIVASNIKRFLKDKGYTQTELANYLGVTRACVCNWIAVETSPDINNIAEICKFLEISINDLFGIYDDKNLTIKEKVVILKYRTSDHQNAIDHLLDIKN